MKTKTIQKNPNSTRIVGIAAWDGKDSVEEVRNIRKRLSKEAFIHKKDSLQESTLSDSEQTIKEIRELRWKLSKEIHSWEDFERAEKEVDEEMKRIGITFRKSNR